MRLATTPAVRASVSAPAEAHGRTGADGVLAADAPTGAEPGGRALSVLVPWAELQAASVAAASGAATQAITAVGLMSAAPVTRAFTLKRQGTRLASAPR